MEIREGRFAIVQVSVAGGDVVPLQLPLPTAYLCDITSDGGALLVRGFKSFWKEEGPLWSVPTLGGSPRRLGDFQAYDGAWSPDGRKICYSSRDTLYLANRDVGDSRKLVTVQGEPWWPRWSPDGGRLRFSVFDPGKNTNSIWEVSAGGTNLRPLLPGWNDPPAECCGNWRPDGRHYLLQSSRHGVDGIWSIAEGGPSFFKRGRTPVQLTSWPMNFRGPVPSKDGERIFAKGTLLRSEVTRFDSKSGHFLPFLERISIETLDFSPDGQWIAYTSVPEGTLWRSRADGSERLQLTFAPVRAALPRWLPDGTGIAFMARSPGKPWNSNSSAPLK